MSKRTIGADGLDELPGNEVEDVPVWHSCVGDGWEPVLIGEMTADNEDELLATGWVAQQDSGGFVYSVGMRPRRRRPRVFFGVAITGTRDGLPFEHNYTIKPGERISASDDGFLVFLDKPQTEGQVQS